MVFSKSMSVHVFLIASNWNSHNFRKDTNMHLHHREYVKNSLWVWVIKNVTACDHFKTFDRWICFVTHHTCLQNVGTWSLNSEDCVHNNHVSKTKDNYLIKGAWIKRYSTNILNIRAPRLYLNHLLQVITRVASTSVITNTFSNTGKVCIAPSEIDENLYSNHRFDFHAHIKLC